MLIRNYTDEIPIPEGWEPYATVASDPHIVDSGHIYTVLLRTCSQ